jgi:RimJ/RimL family protein N-acetyltransferase
MKMDLYEKQLRGLVILNIRKIRVSDAENFILLTQQVESSSKFMLREDGERTANLEEKKQRIKSLEKSQNSTILVVENNEELIGYLVAIGGSARRNKDSVYIVIGILKEYRGLGIGSKLFKEIQRWASEQNIHRLELSVVTQNEAGLSLYKKLGFEIEGTKRDSLFIDGDFVDEYYMSKLL